MKKNTLVVVVAFLVVSCGNNVNTNENTVLKNNLEYDESLVRNYLPYDCPSLMPLDTLCGDDEDTIIFIPQERFSKSFRSTLNRWCKIELGDESYTSEELVVWGWVKESSGYSYRVYPDGLYQVVVKGERYSSVGVDIFVPFKGDTIFAYVYHSK